MYITELFVNLIADLSLLPRYRFDEIAQAAGGAGNFEGPEELDGPGQEHEEYADNGVELESPEPEPQSVEMATEKDYSSPGPDNQLGLSSSAESKPPADT